MWQNYDGRLQAKNVSPWGFCFENAQEHSFSQRRIQVGMFHGSGRREKFVEKLCFLPWSSLFCMDHGMWGTDKGKSSFDLAHSSIHGLTGLCYTQQCLGA